MSADYLHKEYPKQFDRDAFWEQIKRTVNGKPVSDQDIRMIVDQIQSSLDLRSDERLLDLGCGNAALTSYLFGHVQQYFGVDFSDYLIGVAREFFSHAGKTHYYCDDAVAFTNAFEYPEKIDKVVIYGVISYLAAADVEHLVSTLSNRYTSCKRIFIGNIPHRSKAAVFFRRRNVEQYRLDDPESAIGIWWAPEEFIRIGNMFGYDVDILTMPESFYGAEYRFDVLLKRP